MRKLNDNSNAQLGHFVFNGNNYVNWNRSVSLALGARNKLGFTDGSLARQSDESEDLQKWVRNDYMVTSWLLNSIDKSIIKSFIFTPSTRDLCLKLLKCTVSPMLLSCMICIRISCLLHRMMYGQSNATQLYDLYKNLMSIT